MRAISRETGHDFRTIKKYVEQADFSRPIQKRQKHRTKIEAVREIIDNWLIEDIDRPPNQRHTAHKIYKQLEEEYAGLLNASERTVRAYVSAKKKEIYGCQEGALPLEHPPGEAQADFGEVYCYEQGKLVKRHELVLSFPYSNAAYVQLFKGQNQECLLQGLQDIFEHIGRMPSVIWFDNLAAAVVSITGQGERKLVEQFQRFSLHYGFEPRFCNPNSAHEKGNVENKVGYVRRNFFVPEPAYDDIEAFNRQLFTVVEADQNRLHYLKEISIRQLFQADIEAMRQLPRQPFEVARWSKASVNKVGKLKFETNTYSTSPFCAGREVWVKAGAHYLDVLDDNYSLIIRHQRLYGTKLEAMNWYPYLATLAKRPNALKYSGLYRELPHPWQDYLDACSYDQKKNSLKVLARILTEQDMNTAALSLERCLERGTVNAEAILFSYYRLTQVKIEELTDIPGPSAYDPDLGSYDLLLKAGGSR